MFLFQDRQRPAARQARSRPMIIEPLEGRLVLSPLIVSNTNDSGAGSLRQAIISSNDTAGSSTITIDFAIGKSGVVETIALKSALPPLIHPVVINGASEPGTTTAPLIVVSSLGAGSSASGFTFESTASGSTLEGVAVVGFSSFGVLLQGTSGVAISNDDIGTANGTSAIGNGVGLGVSGGLKNSIIDDTISANLGDGVALVTTSGNIIEGDHIGTDFSGENRLGNGGVGVLVNDSSGNFVGEPGFGDTISANGVQGVRITGSTATKNVVAGDFIGTDTLGKIPLGNGTDKTDEHSGVIILGGASGNTIGGTTTSARDVISGNGYDGVHICSGDNSNTVEGDDIGMGANGTLGLGNGQVGVEVDSGSAGNVIGVSGAGNTIADNLASGVWLDDVGVSNVVAYDLILGNGSGNNPVIADMGIDGVRFTGSPLNTVISECTIESNSGYGINYESGGSAVTSGNVIPATGPLANKKGTIHNG
jgi:hypothetical protein